MIRELRCDQRKNPLQILPALLLLAALGLEACRKTINAGEHPSLDDLLHPPTGELLTEKLVVNGVTRRYALYVPGGLRREPSPLVFELHGGGVTIEDLTGESGYKTPYKLWMPLADRENFLVVYPEGLNGAYGKPTWNDCRADASVNSTADDVHFIENLIDTLSSRYSVDAERVYVSGTSNGGLMALRLAVELSGRIAAVASVAAAMPDSSECGGPENPVSVLFMNGTEDRHLPYAGGIVSDPPNPAHGSVRSVESSVRFWVKFDAADTIPTVRDFPDLDRSDGSTVVRYAYSGGKQGTEVVLYKIIGGGHSAPSILERYSRLFERSFGKQNHDIEMVLEIWNFFAGKTLH